MKTLTPTQFQQLLAVIHCANRDDFGNMFKSNWEHYWNKFTSKDNVSFICYLDSCNMKIVFNYFYDKMQAQNKAA